MKHLDVRYMWLQEELAKGTYMIKKLPRSENPADMFTTYIDKAARHKHVKRLGLGYGEGRPSAAPQLTLCIYVPDCVPSGNIQLH